jgi:esterase
MTQPPTNSPEPEFESLLEVAAELGIDPSRIPAVTRLALPLEGDQRLSVLVWGTATPELVLLHGGGQNARTWDLVALALGRAAIAIDLPGHGHSSWRADHDYGPGSNASAVAVAVAELAPQAAGVVGMSLGGLTTIRLAATRPDLVRKAVLVDVTPGSPQASRQLSVDQRGATALTRGPRRYARLEEMVEAAVRVSPRRPPSAVRRGVINNAKQEADGTWTWRYDRHNPDVSQFEELWDDLSGLAMPMMLVQGGDSAFVRAEDLDEVIRRTPSIRVEEVANAGHSVQSDQPRTLANLIGDFLTQG